MVRVLPAVPLAASLASVALLAACSPRTESADLVLTGGHIFTADTLRPWVEALAIKGDRIVAIGADSQVLAKVGDGTRRIALAGRTVIPGINDAHAHVGAEMPGVGFATTTDPAPDPVLQTVLDSIALLVTRAPQGTWLRTEVGERILADPRARRAVLDAVAPSHPVLLFGWSGHGAVLNSAGLREAGLADSADPMGGWLERDRAGTPTGLVDEYGWYNASRRLTSARGAAPAAAALAAYDGMAAAFGITTTQNMATGLTPQLLAEVHRGNALHHRHRVIPFEMTTSGTRETTWTGAKGDSGLLTVSGRKWILDGTPIERLALVRTPYADRARWHGRANFPYDTLRAMLQEAVRGNWQPMFHAVGDSSIALVINAMRATAPDSTWRRLRPRLEHADMLMADQIADVKALGIVIVQNPSHLTLPLLVTRWGPQRMARVDIIKSIVAAGIPFALGSDGPVNPYLNIMFATLNPMNPAEALTREQAVRAYTVGSAYAEGMERDKGTLMVGKLADLTVLSQDIFAVPPDALPATTSLFTLVGGKATLDKLSPAKR